MIATLRMLMKYQNISKNGNAFEIKLTKAHWDKSPMFVQKLDFDKNLAKSLI